jgi:hypothetical protein
MKRLLLALIVSLTRGALGAEPRPNPNAVTLPTFIFGQRHAVTAGHAFLLEEKGERFLVTAYHVLGPPGGLKTKIAARDVPREVKAIAGLCLGDGETVLLGAPLLLVENAKPFDADGADRDVVFAKVKASGGPTPFTLSSGTLKLGDRVWLFARLLDRDRPMTYPAEITELSPGIVQYRMEDPTLNLRALSGAPVVNADGAVVAMHLGFGQKEEALMGAAAPAAGIRERLSAAPRPAAEE